MIGERSVHVDIGNELSIVTAPTSSLFTKAEVMEYIRTDVLEESDKLVNIFIGSAVDIIEKYLGRALLNTQFLFKANQYPDTFLFLPRSPLQQVDNIKVYTEAASTTLTAGYDEDYVVFDTSEPPMIQFFGPVAFSDVRGLQVTFTAGYGTTKDDIPDAILLAVLDLTKTMVEERKIITPAEFQATDIPTLLSSYVVNSDIEEYVTYD